MALPHVTLGFDSTISYIKYFFPQACVNLLEEKCDTLEKENTRKKQERLIKKCNMQITSLKLLQT